MKKKKQTKRGFVILSSAAVLGVLFLGTTMALLRSNSGMVVNAFKGAVVNVAVVEEGAVLENSTKADFLKVTRDTWVDKDVKIMNKNTDMEGNPLETTDTYVRVRLVPIFRNEAGEAIPWDMSKVKYQLNYDDNWVAKDISQEKYYYYKEKISPGDCTSFLLKKVMYQGNPPQNATLELQVLVEGVAANQQHSYDSAWK